jgi:hypothetical protein
MVVRRESIMVTVLSIAVGALRYQTRHRNYGQGSQRMIPAVIMSIFVDGNADRFLSDNSSCGERNHGRRRFDKRNILPRDSRKSGRVCEIQARGRQ